MADFLFNKPMKQVNAKPDDGDASEENQRLNDRVSAVFFVVNTWDDVGHGDIDKEASDEGQNWGGFDVNRTADEEENYSGNDGG